MTARQAVQALVAEGFAYRVERQGSFVEDPRIRFSVGSFTRAIVSAGRMPGAQVLHTESVRADDFLARSLSIEVGAPVHHLQRLRFVEGDPVAIEDIYLPADRFPRIPVEGLSRSLWELLEELYGVKPRQAEAKISCGIVGEREASLLGLRSGQPVIHLTRTIWEAEGKIMEFARDTYRGDRSDFVVTVAIDSDR